MGFVADQSHELGSSDLPTRNELPEVLTNYSSLET